MNNKIKDLASIEKKLDSFLQPVNPEDSFALKLKDRLLIVPDITVEKPNYIFILVLIGSIFFIGVLIVWILNRIMNRKSE